MKKINGLSFSQYLHNLIVKLYYHSLWLLLFYALCTIIICLVIGYIFYLKNKKEIKEAIETAKQVPYLPKIIFANSFSIIQNIKVYFKITENKINFGNFIEIICVVYHINLLKLINLFLKYAYLNKIIYHLADTNKSIILIDQYSVNLSPIFYK